MDELIKALETLYSKEGINLIDGCIFDSSEESSAVETLACKLLISDGGNCNWDNINVLRSSGYRVYRGDGDSFGWLTGCIQKRGDSRIVVYG